MTKNERHALEAATATGFLVTDSSARRLRNAWRAHCNQADIPHAEALRRASTFEFKLGLNSSRHRLSRDARQAIDRIFSLAGSRGSAGITGAYAADITSALLEQVVSIILGVVALDRLPGALARRGRT